jgi:hypothetical protein
MESMENKPKTEHNHNQLNQRLRKRLLRDRNKGDLRNMSEKWYPTKEDFDNPTPALINWLQTNLMYYTDKGNTRAINLFTRLLEQAQAKNPVIIRSLDQPKKKTIVYDGTKLYSVKEEPLQSLEPPQELNVSLFGYYPVSSEQIKKPKPPPEPPKGYDNRLEMKVKAKLGETLNPQERQLRPQYPAVCNISCPYFKSCPYGRSSNFGKPCQQKIEWERKNP